MAKWESWTTIVNICYTWVAFRVCYPNPPIRQSKTVQTHGNPLFASRLYSCVPSWNSSKYFTSFKQYRRGIKKSSRSVPLHFLTFMMIENCKFWPLKATDMISRGLKWKSWLVQSPQYFFHIFKPSQQRLEPN